jgi:hypothetical protein
MIKVLNKYTNINAHPIFGDIKRRGKDAILRATKREAILIAASLANTTPIDTSSAAGVSANEVGFKRREVYKGHPALGYSKNELGWHVNTRVTIKQTYFAITNRMWRPYLQYVEYLHPRLRGFVGRAWLQHRGRLKSNGINFSVIYGNKRGGKYIDDTQSVKA